MMEIKDQVLSGDQAIDDHIYIRCTFRDARLLYEGGQPPGFEDCAFENANFVFKGAAGNTLGFLRAMSPTRTGMREVVVGLLPELNA